MASLGTHNVPSGRPVASLVLYSIIDKFPNSWLVMQRYVVDGNFTAQHMNMKQPHLDVTLSDGLGYMVTEADYQAHLLSAQESKEVCSMVFELSVTF